MLKKLYYKYLRSMLIFSIVIVITYIILRNFAPDLVSANLPYLIVAFLLISAFTHYIIVKTDVERIEFKPDTSLPKDEQMKQLTAIERKFITRYMLTITIKLLGFLVLLVLYAYFNRADFFKFAINFLVLYFLYSFFEIVYLKKPVVGKSKS
ncbi:MAG: hypothetical protein J5606_02850 [Bacteroidales bacterium]|nr:hypothetical protein [Bacteroidales bacterium]